MGESWASAYGRKGWAEGLEKTAAAVWMVFFAVCFTFHLFIESTLSDRFDSEAVRILYAKTAALALVSCALVLALSGLRGLKEGKAGLLRCLLYLAAACAIFFWWMKRGQNFYEMDEMLLLLFAISSGCMSARKIFRILLRIEAGYFILLLLLSQMGLISNEGGNSYGAVYHTDYACRLLFMVLMYCFLCGGVLTWQGELAIFLILLADLFLIGGKTAAVCLILVLAGTLTWHYRREGKVPFQSGRGKAPAFVRPFFRLLYQPARFFSFIALSRPGKAVRKGLRVLETCSFLIFMGVIVLLTARYQPLSAWLAGRYGDRFFTFLSRLQMSDYALSHYGIRLLGNRIPQHVDAGGSGGDFFYFMLDSSYIKLLAEYGLLITVVAMGILTAAGIRLKKEHLYYELFLLSVAALDCAMEHHILDISVNLFPVLAFAGLDGQRERAREASAEKLQTEEASAEKLQTEAASAEKLQAEAASAEELQAGEAAAKRAGKARAAWKTAGTVLLILFLVWWNRTAHMLANVSMAWEPAYRAVYIVPGDEADELHSSRLLQAKLHGACKALSENEGSVLIVCGSSEMQNREMTEILTQLGVPKNRIYEAEPASSVSGMAAHAAALRESLNLTDRLTVLCPKMSMRRVAAAAAAVYSPIRVKSVDVPASLYLPVMFLEQVRITFPEKMNVPEPASSGAGGNSAEEGGGGERDTEAEEIQEAETEAESVGEAEDAQETETEGVWEAGTEAQGAQASEDVQRAETETEGSPGAGQSAGMAETETEGGPGAGQSAGTAETETEEDEAALSGPVELADSFLTGSRDPSSFNPRQVFPISFQDAVGDWNEAHPSAPIVEKSAWDYAQKLNYAAGTEDLPDLFVIRREEEAAFRRMGLIGETYPAGGTRCSVVIYDRRVFPDGFPGDWAELEDQLDRITARGYQGAVCIAGEAVTQFLVSGGLSDGPSRDLLSSLEEKERRGTFLDAPVTDAMTKVSSLLSEGIFGDSYLQDREGAERLFREGKYAALITDSGSALSLLMAMHHDERYQSLEFADLPGDVRIEYAPRLMAVSSALAQDPGRYETAVRFGEYVEESADRHLSARFDMLEEYQKWGAETWKRYRHFLENDHAVSPDVTGTMDPGIWNRMNEDILRLAQEGGDIRVGAELAEQGLQDIYEQTWLNG